MTPTKKRRPAVAALLTLLGGGVGFLYIGNVPLAAALTVAPVALLAIAAVVGIVFSPAGFYLVAVSEGFLLVAPAVLAAVYARRQGEVALHWYQRWYFYVLWFAAFAIPVNLVFKYRADLFGYDTFRFPSSSMRNTLLPGDFFVSNTWKYRQSLPVRGELIVFRFPSDPNVKYVKRLIGLPGDVVAIKHGVVSVNGKPLVEPYVSPENNLKTAETDLQFSVPPNSLFVLGDNRDRSNDSRYWGAVPLNHLHGSVEFVWFSWGQGQGLRLDRFGIRVD